MSTVVFNNLKEIFPDTSTNEVIEIILLYLVESISYIIKKGVKLNTTINTFPIELLNMVLMYCESETVELLQDAVMDEQAYLYSKRYGGINIVYNIVSSVYPYKMSKLPKHTLVFTPKPKNLFVNNTPKLMHSITSTSESKSKKRYKVKKVKASNVKKIANVYKNQDRIVKSLFQNNELVEIQDQFDYDDFSDYFDDFSDDGYSEEEYYPDDYYGY